MLSGPGEAITESALREISGADTSCNLHDIKIIRNANGPQLKPWCSGWRPASARLEANHRAPISPITWCCFGTLMLYHFYLGDPFAITPP